jgi:hypothetical protein
LETGQIEAFKIKKFLIKFDQQNIDVNKLIVDLEILILISEKKKGEIKFSSFHCIILLFLIGLQLLEQYFE